MHGGAGIDGSHQKVHIKSGTSGVLRYTPKALTLSTFQRRLQGETSTKAILGWNTAITTWKCCQNVMKIVV